MRFLIFFGILLFMLSCDKKPHFSQYNISKQVFADSAMVVSAHPVATQIGIDILKAGGNAVDASIAVQFVLAVCYPAAGNIGGGGFMLFRDKNGNVSALDYREMAPAKATEKMFLDENGNAIMDKSIYGQLAAGVPGSVAGMYEAFQKYSQLKDWKKLVQPAIDVANNGFLLTLREIESLNSNDSIFQKVNGRKTEFNNQKWKPGDVLIQKDLAETLTEIRDKGVDGFYKGKVADLIVKEMGNTGMITHDDLLNYKAIWRVPIHFNYKGHKIHSMPPPSSGGIILNQLLKSIEPFDIKAMGFQSPEAVHLMVEAERRAYADRSKHLGDADYFKVPQEQITDSNYIAQRMKDFNASKATLSADINAGIVKESEQTTHLNIIDKDGNAVAVTTTLNGSYGSYVVVDGAGFILNNEMDDFSVKPGTPNLYGLVGAEANKIEAGKRMLSSMTPTIVEKNGKVKMIVGTPGGSTIITSVFQTLVNVLDFDMSAAKAVTSPRFHHQWLPDSIQVEKDCLSPKTRTEIESLGHKFKPRGNIGRVEAILIHEDGKIEGAADTRGDDDAKGY